VTPPQSILGALDSRGMVEAAKGFRGFRQLPILRAALIAHAAKRRRVQRRALTPSHAQSQVEKGSEEVEDPRLSKLRNWTQRKLLEQVG
jgi:hypothetical protein